VPIFSLFIILLKKVYIEFKEIFQKLHGNPKIVVSDRDQIFTCNFWIGLLSCLGTKLAHRSSYNP
jgi:hypothetical protein